MKDPMMWAQPRGEPLPLDAKLSPYQAFPPSSKDPEANLSLRKPYNWTYEPVPDPSSCGEVPQKCTKTRAAADLSAPSGRNPPLSTISLAVI